MPFVACPCGKKFRATDALAGKQVNCPGCGRPLLIPQASLLDEELDRRSHCRRLPLPLSRHAQHLSIPPRSKAGCCFCCSTVAVSWSSRSCGCSFPCSVGMAAGNLRTNWRRPPAEQAVNGLECCRVCSRFDQPIPDNRQPELEARSPDGRLGPRSRPPRPRIRGRRPLQASPPRPPKCKSRRSRNLPRRRGNEPRGATLPKPARPGGGPSRRAENTIRLSAGVALAQTLPTGTAMGFSVDYEFVDNPPGGPVKPGLGSRVGKRPGHQAARRDVRSGDSSGIRSPVPPRARSIQHSHRRPEWPSAFEIAFLALSGRAIESNKRPRNTMHKRLHMSNLTRSLFAFTQRHFWIDGRICSFGSRCLFVK